MEPLLEIKHYSISFHQYDASWNQITLDTVKDLNLAVYPGEVVAIIGASGSGKSLLAHGILGILPYNAWDQGEMSYAGEPLTPKRQRQLRGKEIVLIPQSTAFLDPLMKVDRQICKGNMKPTVRNKMREILKRYHLDLDVEKKYPFELSGGMARRVLLTMAHMEQPRLVIADEPTPGLQKKVAVQALGHLRELAQEGAGVLLITHDLQQALAVADRIVVFYQGRTIEEASAQAFLQEETLQHPYTRALWRAMPEHGFSLEKTEEEFL